MRDYSLYATHILKIYILSHEYSLNNIVLLMFIIWYAHKVSMWYLRFGRLYSKWKTSRLFLQSDYLICLLNHAWPNLLSFLKTSSVYFPRAYQFASWKLKYRLQTHHLLRLNLCFSKCIEPNFIPDENEKLDITITLYFTYSISTNWRMIIFAKLYV